MIILSCVLIVVLSVTSSDATQVSLPAQLISSIDGSAAPAAAKQLNLVHGLYGRPSIVSARSTICPRHTT